MAPHNLVWLLMEIAEGDAVWMHMHLGGSSVASDRTHRNVATPRRCSGSEARNGALTCSGNTAHRLPQYPVTVCDWILRTVLPGAMQSKLRALAVIAVCRAWDAKNLAPENCQGLAMAPVTADERAPPPAGSADVSNRRTSAGEGLKTPKACDLIKVACTCRRLNCMPVLPDAQGSRGRTSLASRLAVKRPGVTRSNGDLGQSDAREYAVCILYIEFDYCHLVHDCQLRSQRCQLTSRTRHSTRPFAIDGFGRGRRSHCQFVLKLPARSIQHCCHAAVPSVAINAS